MAVLDVTGMEGRAVPKLTIMIPTRIKKRVVFFAIAFLWVWPIIHHGIVTAYDMDPWLYFGMSMYARPRPTIYIGAMEAAYPGQPFQSVNRDAVQASLPLQRNLQMLANGRTNYGTLYNPEPVVKEIFKAFPRNIARLAFTVRSLSLNAEGMLVAQDTRTECRKGEEPGNVECAVVPGARRALKQAPSP